MLAHELSGLGAIQTPDSTTVWSYASFGEVPYCRDYEAATGRGSFGAVFRATRCVGAEVQVYAVKEIVVTDLEHKEKILKEVKFLHRCQHPHILKLEEVYVIDKPTLSNVIYLVTWLWAPLTLHRFFDILNSSKTDFIPSYPWYVPQCDLPWTTITSGCQCY